MKKTMFAIAAASLLATPAFAALTDEVSTAQAHAGMAAAQADITKVHMHLQHALNCLVGPSGDGFNAAPGNPCNGKGNGAITDTADAGQKSKLTAAAATAKAGVANADLAGAQAAAKQTADEVAAAK